MTYEQTGNVAQTVRIVYNVIGIACAREAVRIVESEMLCSERIERIRKWNVGVVVHADAASVRIVAREDRGVLPLNRTTKEIGRVGETADGTRRIRQRAQVHTRAPSVGGATWEQRIDGFATAIAKPAHFARDHTGPLADDTSRFELDRWNGNARTASRIQFRFIRRACAPIQDGPFGMPLVTGRIPTAAEPTAQARSSRSKSERIGLEQTNGATARTAARPLVRGVVGCVNHFVIDANRKIQLCLVARGNATIARCLRWSARRTSIIAFRGCTVGMLANELRHQTLGARTHVGLVGLLGQTGRLGRAALRGCTRQIGPDLLCRNARLACAGDLRIDA